MITSPNTNITILSQAMITRKGSAICKNCEKEIKVGEKIASRRTKNHRWYHYKCATKLNIC
jgi:hypothetical protein|tara:strand:+ start:2084 stop:2266 length:183 start_codon:yes stop_codon:yes gene_type:complete